MIRSALKSGIKKLADRVLGAPVPAPAPPAPSWKTAAPASSPAPSAPTVSSASAAPVAGPAASAPTVSSASAAPVAAPAASTPEVAPPAAVVPASGASLAGGSEPDVQSGADNAEPPSPSRGKKPPKAKVTKQQRAAETTARLEDAVPVTEPVPAETMVAAPPPVEAAAAAPAPADDVVGPALSMEALQEVIDEMVRPALQGDGGDITLLRIEGGKVFVKLVGACSTCPSSIATLKLGVEALLKEEFPAIEEIIQEM